MLRALIPALLVSTACAQTAANPARLGELAPELESRDAGTLRCEVTGLAPVLNFSMRFEAAYTVRVPLAQFTGPGHKLNVLVRVRPQAGGAPVYLAARFPVPDARPAAAGMQAGGGYLVGAGRYAARAMVYDEAARVCRHEWTIDAHLGPGQAGINVAMPPNTVEEFSVAPAPAAMGPPKLGALTVLLDAAPFDPHMSSLPAADVATLTGALVSLLEQTSARRVRVVVFNLELQKELWRDDGFTAAGISRVADALNSLQVATVDYHVLQNRGGHLALLAGLVNRELRAEEPRAEEPSGAVVFLSPRVLHHDQVPAELIEDRAGKPRFYLIQFRPYMRIMPPPDMDGTQGRRGRGSAAPRADTMGGRGGRGLGGIGTGAVNDYPDTIAFLVSRLKGKIFQVHSPTEFAKAIRHMIQAGS